MSPVPFVRSLLVGVVSTLLLAAALSVRAVPIHDFSAVTTEMQAFVQTYRLDGASLRVGMPGNVVYRQAFGGYTTDTRLRIASASKWLSALAIARLVEQGHLRWNDTVGRYFPQVEAVKRDITLAQLFSHISGLPANEHACLSNPLYTLATCAERILQEPLIGEPGKVFGYGGNSMQVAGRMAELATGRAWDDLFLDNMVRPLGLVATDYATASTAPGYVRTDNPRIAGGVRSTLDDYGRVVDMVMADGCLDTAFPDRCAPARRFLSRATLDEMARDHTVGTVDVSRPPTGTGYGYGLGQWIDPTSPSIVSSPGAFGFTPWVDRAKHVSGVLLVDDVNTRLAADINDIRRMIEVVTTADSGRRIRVRTTRDSGLSRPVSVDLRSPPRGSSRVGPRR